MMGTKIGTSLSKMGNILLVLHLTPKQVYENQLKLRCEDEKKNKGRQKESDTDPSKNRENSDVTERVKPLERKERNPLDRKETSKVIFFAKKK